MGLILEILVDLITMGLTALCTWLHVQNTSQVHSVAVTVATALLTVASATGAIIMGRLRQQKAVAIAECKASLPPATQPEVNP